MNVFITHFGFWIHSTSNNFMPPHIFFFLIHTFSFLSSSFVKTTSACHASKLFLKYTGMLLSFRVSKTQTLAFYLPSRPLSNTLVLRGLPHNAGLYVSLCGGWAQSHWWSSSGKVPGSGACHPLTSHCPCPLAMLLPPLWLS